MLKQSNYVNLQRLQDHLAKPETKITCSINEISKQENKIKIREFSLNFGETILKNGYFQNSDDLSKTHFSFGILLENACEIFVDDASETMPIEILKPGQFFPIDEMDGFEHVLPKHLLNMTAGARSIFLSPKISDTICFARLAKKYKLELDIPKNLYDEWELLVNLARNSESPWRAKILVISIERELFFSEEFEPLRACLIQSTLNHHKTLKNWALFDMNRSSFLAHESYKVDTALLDHVKKVCFIGNGMIPGFVFATNELLAPTELFKQIFIETYGIQYTPHIIHPGTVNQAQLCYYPIQNKGCRLTQRQRETGFSQLKEFKRTFHHFQDFLSTSQDDIAWTIFKSSEISFFHHNPGKNPKIKPSSQLPEIDPAIATAMQNSNLPFCHTSPFLRSGCIAIKPQSVH